MDELIPKEGDPKVGYRVFEILDEILKYRENSGRTKAWNRYYELRRNKHWKSPKNSKHTLLTANLLGKSHHNTVNMLTDNNPTFNAVQTGETDPEALDSMLRTCENWWTEQEQQNVFYESVSDGELYGTVVEKVSFDIDKEFPYGEVDAETVSMFNFGWYPVKERDIQECEAVLHFFPLSVRKVKRQFSKFKDMIVADSDYLKQLGDTRSEISLGEKHQGYVATFAGIIKNLVGSGAVASDDNENVLMVECWVRDYTEVGGEAKYFGNIRRIIAGCGGKIVFSDDNNPSINPELSVEDAIKTYCWDKYPFSKNYSVTDTASPFGMADYEQLEDLNIEVNKTLSAITLVKDKGSALKFVNPKDSGIPDTHFLGGPAIIRPTSTFTASGLKWLEPPRLDANMLQALTIYKDLFFTIAGTFDLDQADSAGRNVIAYKALAVLLENVSRMLKDKIRNYSKMIRERGRMYISHGQNWYTEDRWITYEKNGKKNTGRINGKSLLIPAKLTVVSGSTMPRSQVQEREESIELFKMSAIDQEALLEKIDFPDYKKILERMQQGPFGELFKKLTELGVPEGMLQYFQDIAGMEEKDIESAVKSGELPLFDQIIQSLQGQSEQPQTSPVDGAEVEVKMANARKIDAEIELIREKIVTERLEREVKIKGVEFDEEKLKIERTKILEELKANDENRRIERVKTLNSIVSSVKSNKQGPYQERGLVSNNV